MNDGYCDVDIEVDCDEPASDWIEQQCCAAKPHYCCECRAAITKNERHIKVRLCTAGRWELFRICLACDEIAREFMSPRVVGGILWEEFDYQWDNGANVQGCMNRVSTVAAKRKLLEQWTRRHRLEVGG